MEVAIVVADSARDWSVEDLRSEEGCSCSLFNFDSGLANVIGRSKFDLFIVFGHIGDGHGLRVTEALRRCIGDSPPILLVGERSEKKDRLNALNAGADDLFNADGQSVDLFMARVKFIIRRTRASPGALERFGPYVFDYLTHSVRFSGKIIKLTPKEFGLATFMFRNMNKIVSREVIGRNVWGQRMSIDTRTIDIHTSKVRGKLNLDGLRYDLSSMYGRGYILRNSIREG